MRSKAEEQSVANNMKERKGKKSLFLTSGD